MRLAVVWAAALALAAALAAQNIPNPGDATSPAPAEPGHALLGEPHETVNPANGSLTIAFSLPLPPGRGGFTPAFTISYSSAGSHPFGSFGNDMANMYAQSSLFSSDGWSYGAPVLTYTTADIPLNDGSGMVCTTSSDYMAQMPDGSRQQLLLSDTGRASGNRPNPVEACDDWIDETASASLEGWAASTTALVDSYWRWEPVTLTSPDGTALQFPGSGVPEFGALATTMTDRNGNQVAYSVTGGNALPSSPFALTLTDTLGRVLTTSGFAQPTDTITVPGMSSPYSVSWSSEPASGTVTVEGDPNGGPNTCPNTVAALHGGTAVTSITTPSGTYTFSYDPTWGVVDKITYPNGGYVRYVWGLEAETEPAELQTWNGSAYQACYARFDNPVITDRYVSPDGSTETEHQSFTYATTWGTSIYLPWTEKTTTEVDTDSVAGTTRTIAYAYSPGGQPPPPNSGTFIAGFTPLESTVTTEDGGGNPLRVVTEAWDGPLLPPADQQTVQNGVNRLRRPRRQHPRPPRE